MTKMPLQKSFSDTNHSSKQRPQWHRNRSVGAPQTVKAHTSKPLQDKCPVAVSTATKNKLSAFQFNGQSNADTIVKGSVISLLSQDEKENEGIMGMGDKITVNEQDAVDDNGQTIMEKRDITELGGQSFAEGRKNTSEAFESIHSDHIRSDFPSTPAARLALPDLIGMEDVRRVVQDISPEDRIEWDRHSSASSFGLRRAKKRARSSSPISSPAVQTYLNPQINPSSELWGRYSLSGSNAPTPQETTVPALAHIMQTSSPRPSKDGTTPRSVAGFRRTTSCGSQFPKRRRVTGLEDDDIFSECATIGPSKLSVLIERVQEGFAQTKQSKVVEPGVLEKCSSEGSEKRDLFQKTKHPKQDSTPSKTKEKHPAAQDHSNSSDYGDFDDDDLDDASLLEILAVDKEIPITTNIYSSKPEPPPELPQLQPGSIAQPPTANASNTIEPMPVSFDTGLNVVADPDKKNRERKVTRAMEETTGSRPQKVLLTMPESDDEFGDGGLDDVDFEVAERAATQSIQQTSSLLPSTQKVHTIQRYFVTNVVESEYESNNGRAQREKILFLEIENSKITKTVNLRGTWFDTPVTKEAFVHIIGAFESNGRCIIDDANNLIILHPDHLISSTVVADSFSCTRRAVLQDRVKATSDSSSPLVYGTILHEIFQAAMIANRWETEWLNEEIENIAARHIEDLYTISVQVPQAVEYLKSKMGELQSWAELFVSSQPQPGALVDTGGGGKALMCVSKLLDVEEHVWSPMYGLKGNIDATVQVTMKDGKASRTLTVPFEVKTGKNPSAAHRAQTALYNLLLSDRYDVDVAYGILYYMETSQTIRIPAIRHELRHMIMQRNELACFVRERHAQLPPMLKKKNMCNGCYAKTPCFIYHRLADNGDGESSGMQDKFDAIVKHLTPKHKEFFLKWDDLLTKEERESLRFRRELWTMLSSEREKRGRCFSNVIIEPGSAYEEKNNPKINRYRYTLVKQAPPAGFSFLDSQIIVGEPIVISDEKGHFALANGYVTLVRKHRITVAVDRRLHNARIRRPGFDEVDNQVFASIMEVAQEGATPEQSTGKMIEEPVQYRLDKDEFSNGMATARNNLIQVMAEGPFGSREIRDLVVDLNAPRFKTQSTAYTLSNRENINVDQQRAIQKVMSAQDYALVLGMPGTGKTTTIAHIIRALVSQGKNVLLASYTHTAVDNILLKLKDDNIPILRLGATAKIHADVQEFATLAASTKTSFEEIRSAWHGSPIVATTCLGINHALFNERTFDYCIVDEASQITLPVCLGPIRLARTFILVGDHNQLPPLVQNEEARTGGLDISLFKHLSDSHPSSVVYLEHQYRMCEDVMALSNNLIYNGRLKCGSQEVAQRRISIPDLDALKLHHHSPSTLSRGTKTFCLGPTRGQCWIRDLLDPDIKVSFINTDPLLPISREEAKGSRIVNSTEATICIQLVKSLLSCGVPASNIGVMTHYRAQLSLLKDGLRQHRDVEMHTADRFQGRDKEVIILSLVRSNESKSIGELLKDWRRINVAFTRAKTKLLVIGSRQTLRGNGPEANGREEMVAKFVGLMEERDWLYNLPTGALEDHHFEDGLTQITASGASRTAASQWPSSNLEHASEDRKGGEKGLGKGEGKSMKKGLLLEDKENKKGQRQPAKRISGNQPFKIPRMSVMTDIVNDAFG